MGVGAASRVDPGRVDHPPLSRRFLSQIRPGCRWNAMFGLIDAKRCVEREDHAHDAKARECGDHIQKLP